MNSRREDQHSATVESGSVENTAALCGGMALGVSRDLICNRFVSNDYILSLNYINSYSEANLTLVLSDTHLMNITVDFEFFEYLCQSKQLWSKMVRKANERSETENEYN